MTTAERLAKWAHRLEPDARDLALAERSLQDTLAVAFAAAGEDVVRIAGEFERPGTWAVAAHALDFDDLHIASTTHISAVVVPTVVACGGSGYEYLAGAGVMARIGTMLGWSHYQLGWHATCTAGAPAAAVAAAMSLELDPVETAHALALAVPAAGGVQRAFGTDAKALQVGMATEAGVRAAFLAARGARAELEAFDQWLGLMGAHSVKFDVCGPAVPGGLAIKLFPCCYAMQRPIHATLRAMSGRFLDRVESVVVRTPAAATVPLIHHRPITALQAKFSLEYAIAVAIIDGAPTESSFTDAAVVRPEVKRLVETVRFDEESGGDGLLGGTCDVTITFQDGSVSEAAVDQPPGSPECPPSFEELGRKLKECSQGKVTSHALDWKTAAGALEAALATPR
jgi:2-methylcitrate dehydratase PrpD